MADAPEVVPDSLSPEMKGLNTHDVISPLSPGTRDSKSPAFVSPLNGDQPEERVNREKQTTNPEEKQAVVTQNDDEAPKTAVSGGIENEEISPKYGYAHDDRAGSGLEAIKEQPFTADAKVAGDSRPLEPDNAQKLDANETQKSKSDNEWHFGFWDFWDPVPLFLESIFCPCVLTGRTHQRLHDPNDEHLSSINTYCGGCCCLSLTTIGALPLYCFMTSAQRREIRYRYNIEGNNLEDCLKATFCVCCALVQEEKEVVHREELKKKALERRTEKMEYANPNKQTSS